MARIQILELPTVYREHGEDETPFVLVIDQTAPQRIALGVDTPWRDYWQDIADKVGARAAIVTPETIDIPANEVTLTEATDGNVVRIRVEPDLAGFREQVLAEVARAQADVRAALK
ncbi:hypothetical protein OG978_33785 [Streptomyces sp. NBC_01591]|uniref:hypothetical protein n=1 Tax=Streptomyces sp. NBC_01591 TaxID=2975888 RepID=UPI002DDAE8CB|nr:hypothetical protein [Streptomyces sp. NBC_01591]WSD71934.1 hypothetical protein OG978_33785 [Streptomyces sp. NBC_01591]